MSSSGRMLLVLGIVEGKRFPPKPRHHLLVEAKFDGEVLMTDPVKHDDCPQFATELAWELDKKALHQHRLQRTPVKLQVFSVDPAVSKKELVGYCVLDLRSAQQEPAKPQWHPLLSSKYQRLKPELKTSLSVELDTPASEAVGSPGDTAPTLAASPARTIEAILDEENGYYRIGPESAESSIFVLSVTIAAARNLSKLIPSHTKLQVEEGFYFYYSLLDNDVTNEPFYDLLAPIFPAERATFRLYCTAESLHIFLAGLQQLEVHLCSSDQTLGVATVSLKPLIGKDFSALSDPAVLEGMFPLRPAKSTSPPASDQSALLGLSIVLKKEETTHGEDNPVTALASPVLPDNGDKGKDLLVEPILKKAAPQPSANAAVPGKPEISRNDKHVDVAVEAHPRDKEIKRGSDVTDDDITDGLNFDDPVAKTAKHENRKQRQFRPDSKGGPASTSQEPNHHFCVSVDVRSISDLDTSRVLNIVCRYTYPFFGSAAPVLTNPPVHVERNMEVLLPQSFCAFEFASSVKLLHLTFMRVPLIVEVWHRDANERDTMLGIAQVQLSRVLSSPKNTSAQPSTWRQVYSEKVPVISAESPARRIGALHMVVGLEDRGVVQAKVAPLVPGQPLYGVDSSVSTQPPSSFETAATVSQPSASADPRHMPEYQVALELEMWRNQQEEQFQTQLSMKEQQLMKTLAEEWKKRDTERELLLKKRVDEYASLEAKLKASIGDLERREKQIAEREVELKQLHTKLVDEHGRKMTELRDSSRRMKEDFEHQLQLEKNHFRDLEERFRRLGVELENAENRLKTRENEIFALKEAQLNKPEVKMQAEMNLLRLEVSELERKLDAVTKSKVHYKQQWGRALRELARIKTNEQEAARARLKKQERELEHMKLRYLAAEEKDLIDATRQQKPETVPMPQTLICVPPAAGSEPTKATPNLTVPDHRYEGRGDVRDGPHRGDASREHRIGKLIEERDTLLQTGVYTLADKVIMELDRQIREAIAADS